MRSESDSSIGDAELRDLAALADGSLPAERRAEVEARLEADPRLRESFEEQRRAVEAVRAATARVEAPAGLRERIDRQRTRSAPAARRRRWNLIGGFAVTAAAAAVVVALVLPVGDPTVAEAADLTVRPPTGPAPEADPSNSSLLDARAEGISYPNWGPSLDWSASGERKDELDGRDATTIYYDRDGKRVGYTILSGDEIDPPEGSQVTQVDGRKFWTFDDDGRTAVVWYREGRTCVMSGEDVPADVLVKLASWKGKGAVSMHGGRVSS